MRRRLTALLLSLGLLLALAPAASAHGCHAGLSRPASWTGYARTQLSASSNNLYDGIKGTAFAPPTVHAGFVRSFIGVYPAPGETGHATIGVQYGSSGRTWFIEFQDDAGNITESGTGTFSGSISFEIRRTLQFGGHASTTFYVNGSAVGSDDGLPAIDDWAGKRVFVYGYSPASGQNQFLGGIGNKFEWAAVSYRRNGNVLGWPATSADLINWAYMKMTVVTSNIDFWDNDC